MFRRTKPYLLSAASPGSGTTDVHVNPHIDLADNSSDDAEEGSLKITDENERLTHTHANCAQ